VTEPLIERVRAALATTPRVEEKKMFGGLAFMVDGKMCVTVNKGRLLVRVDPDLSDTLAAKPGAEMMVMGGRRYRGYVRVDAEVLRTNEELREWIDLALAYNSNVKPRVPKGRKVSNG
jgi:TfoX/Sxy family transcriptional regulator of competence genes